MYLIIISIAVVLILWSFTIKGDYLFAQKQPAQKQPSQKQPTPRPKPKPDSGSVNINYKIKNTAPTTSEIAKGLAALKAHNTSGNVPTSSAYYDLVKRKYLQYDKKQKKWVSYLDPAGKAAPPAIDDGKGSQQGRKTKPVSGGHTSGGGSHTSGGNTGGGSHPSVPHLAPLPQRGSKAPIKPRQSSYCNQGSFYGNTNCSQASSRVTETNVFNGEHTNKFPDTTSPVKAAYLAIGTANEQNIPSSTRYHGPTVSGKSLHLDNRLDNGSYQPAFNYNDSNAVPAIIKALKSRVDVIAKSGANAIRFDELDVCSNGSKCNQANVNKVLTAVSQYAYQAHKMSVLGNNDSYSDNNKVPTSAQAIAQSGVPIAGWIVENDASGGKQLREVLGNNVPIYGVATSRDNANKMSKAQIDGTAAFDSVAVYPK